MVDSAAAARMPGLPRNKANALAPIVVTTEMTVFPGGIQVGTEVAIAARLRPGNLPRRS